MNRAPEQLPDDSSGEPTAHSLALRAAAYYLAFGLLWIVSTDRILNAIFSPEAAERAQTLKGAFFILLTAAGLFFMVRHFVRRLEHTQSQMQKKLQNIAQEYQRLFQRSPAAMIIFDPVSRRILAANDVSTLLYGYSREELLSMRTLDLVVEEERPRAASSNYQTQNVQLTGPWQIRRRDGRIIFVEGITHQVEFNGIQARIAQVTDVTERLQAERSLAQYRTQLEQRVTERTTELSHTNRLLREEISRRQRIEVELRAATTTAEGASEAKSAFLANTSHEIRTPLTSILGYTDLLAGESLAPDERARYFDIVRQNAHHLLALIDDLLDLSRAEIGKVRVSFDGHSPREIAQQVVDLLQPRAAEKNIDLLLGFAADIPERIHTDGMRLRQILLNLLSNAIKFTLQGSVRLRLSLGSFSDGSPCLRFDVIDTGIGMDSDHLQRVFEPFYQVEQGSSHRFGGSGLGLTISKELAQQMGGELTVLSAPGQGSTFTLRLPVIPTSSLPDDPPAALSQATLDCHILMAEDNPNIRLLVDEYLTRAGARVTAVVNGQEAVQRIREAVSSNAVEGQAFDLVLLDLHMPVLDGSQALKRIRELGFTGPVVGLTADYAEKSTAEWTREGWDAMAAKPIDRQAFIPLLARLVAEASSSASTGG